MARRFQGSINLSKISKDKIIAGKKGQYLNITMWLNDEKDQFGNDISIQQTLSKEEIEAKSANIYLGNAKESESARGTNKSFEKDNDLGF